MILSPWGAAALAYHLASRLAYVGWVGLALRRQERHQAFTTRDGIAAGFARFQRVAATLMHNDGASFVLLCLVTRDTLGLAAPPPRAVTVAAGVLLLALGIGVKLWAAATLGAKAYYWHNFFAPAEATAPTTAGPYRFLKNPMYTVGNVHLYGLALVLGSAPALAAALFDHAAVLTFHRLVERPHFDRLTGRPPGA
ncbi:MAG: PEMT/PEM2 family methyltransferase [Gemmatimonadales bacterium]